MFYAAVLSVSLPCLMAEHGRRCDLHLYEGEEHGFFNLWVDRNVLAETLIRPELREKLRRKAKEKGVTQVQLVESVIERL